MWFDDERGELTFSFVRVGTLPIEGEKNLPLSHSRGHSDWVACTPRKKFKIGCIFSYLKKGMKNSISQIIMMVIFYERDKQYDIGIDDNGDYKVHENPYF